MAKETFLLHISINKIVPVSWKQPLVRHWSQTQRQRGIGYQVFTSMTIIGPTTTFFPGQL